MNLTLKDRVLILNTVLPQFDTRKNMILKMAIDSKVALSTVEQTNVVCTNTGGSQVEISFKTADAITSVLPFDFTDEELMYMKQRVYFIDQNGMFSAETIESYMKILDAPFASAEKHAEWNKMMGIVSDTVESDPEGELT